MLSTDQILLLIMIVIIGGTMVLVGVQFYLILRELKKGIETTNRILEEFHEVAANVNSSSQHLKESVLEVKSMATNIKEGISSPLVSGLATFGLVRSILRPILHDDEDSQEE